MSDYVPFTGLQNMTGQPAINLPLHWSKNRLQIGVQFAGRFGEEELLLKVAAQIEAAQPWIDRKTAECRRRSCHPHQARTHRS